MVTDRLSDVGSYAPFTYGKGLPERARNPSGSVPVYGSNGIVGSHDSPLTNGPAVIIGRKGTIGAVHFSAQPCWPIDTTFFITDSDIGILRFKYYLLKSLGFEHMNQDSAVPGLNRDSAHARQFVLPEPGEQRAIAHILGTLDDKIELNRRMNRTLEDIARALFKSWFVDFDPVHAKARGESLPGLDPAFAALFPASFEDSELGPIPAGWHWTNLGSVLSLIETGSRPKGGVGGITHGVPSVGAESIVGVGQFDYSKTKYVPTDFFARMRRGHVRDRDVLLYKDGGRPGEFEPHVAFFGDGFPFDDYCINEHVYRLRIDPRMPQTYLYFWLTSDLAMDEMRRRGTGVAIPGLNSQAVSRLSVLLPPAALLDVFDSSLAPSVSQIFRDSNESRTLAALRDTLLPKLMSGELRAPEAAAMAEAIT